MDDPNINVKIEIKEEMHDVDDEFMCDDDFDEQDLFNDKIDNSELKIEETFIVVEEAADEDDSTVSNPNPDPFNSNLNPDPLDPLDVATIKCEICDKVFKKKGALNEHVKLVHHKIKNHICTLCQYRTNKPSNLNRHLINVHHQKIKCNFCELEFSDYTAYYEHNVTDHKNFRNNKKIKISTEPNKG